jgi:hypothetical protein
MLSLLRHAEMIAKRGSVHLSRQIGSTLQVIAAEPFVRNTVQSPVIRRAPFVQAIRLFKKRASSTFQVGKGKLFSQIGRGFFAAASTLRAAPVFCTPLTHLRSIPSERL